MSAQEFSLSSAGAQAPPPSAAAAAPVSAEPTAANAAASSAETGTSAAAGTSASQDTGAQAAAQAAAPTSDVETLVSDLDFLSDDSELTRELFDTQNNRIPQEARDKWWAAEEGKRVAETSLQALGGETGLQVAQQLLPIVTNPQPTWKDVDTFMDSVRATNGNLAFGITKRLEEGVFADEELYTPWRDKTILREFEGDDLPADQLLVRLKQLHEADKAGRIAEDLLTPYQPSAREQLLEKKVAALESKDKQSDAERERAQAEAKQRVVTEGEGYIARQVNDFVLPLAEKLGRVVKDGEENTPEGKAKIRFGEMQTAWLNEQIRRQPEYQRVQHLIETGRAFNTDSTPTTLFQVNVKPLLNRAHALYKEAARDTQRMFASSQTSNGHRPPGQVPPAGQVPPIAPLELPPNATPEQQREALRKRYQASIRDIGTQATLATG